MTWYVNNDALAAKVKSITSSTIVNALTTKSEAKESQVEIEHFMKDLIDLSWVPEEDLIDFSHWEENVEEEDAQSQDTSDGSKLSHMIAMILMYCSSEEEEAEDDDSDQSE